MSAAEDVQSVMLEILKRIQADVAGVKADVAQLKADVAELKADVADLKSRVTRLEDVVRKQGRDSAAMLVMMRSTVGTYEERLLTIEEDVRLLMEHGSIE